jgi:CRISPR-associated protein Cmr2
VGWSDRLSLVSFTIAGVQDFLAAARTTRDVWNGSYLLSYLAYRATRAMLEGIQQSANRGGLAQVFDCVLMPDVRCQPLMQSAAGQTPDGDLRVANFPNSILLACPGGQEAAAGLAALAEKEVDAAWKEITRAAQLAWAKAGLLKDGNRSAPCRKRWTFPE